MLNPGSATLHGRTLPTLKILFNNFTRHFILNLFCLAEADLRIGEVQWGDSGVYMCKVVISDDLEGQNEASVELLVLGKMTLKSD